MHWTFLEALLVFGIVFMGVMAIFARRESRERRRRRVAPDNILDMLDRCWHMAHEHGTPEFCDEIQAAIDAYQKVGIK